MGGTWARGLLTVGVLIAAASCSGGDEQEAIVATTDAPATTATTTGVTTTEVATPTTEAIVLPTVAEVAARLVTTDTFEGEWTTTAPPDVPGAEFGIVPEELQDQLPRLDICREAGEEVRTTVHELPWMAFRQLDLAVDDPIMPPDDTTGHLVFVQEFLMSAPPDEVTTLFEMIRDGTRACLGDIPAGEEGSGHAELFELPAVGDDRDGALLTVDETGGWAEWRLYTAIVRKGTIFAQIVITDVRAGDDPYFTDAQIGEMVATAVGLL